MKSNLLSLVKIEIAKFLSSFNSRGKKVSRTPILYVFLLILLFAAGLSCLYSWLVISPYVKSEVDTAPAINFFAGISSMLIFMSAMSQARGIYIGEDYDLLITMPIKKRDIVASKILTLYGIELFFSVVVLVPHGIMHIAMAGNVPAFLICLLLAFTLPIVPIAMAAILSLLIAMATARFKSANLVFVVLYALVIVGLIAMSMITSNLSNSQAASGFSSVGGILKWINPSYILAELSLTGNRLYLLLYVAISVAVAVLTVLFFALAFDRLHEIVTSISMRKKYVRKELKVKGTGKALLGLEFKRLVNTKLYFINSILSAIMCVLGSTVYIISMNSAMASASADAVGAMKTLFMPIYIVVAAFIIGIGNPAAGVINIEGKNFWIIKSLPTDYRKYMHAKLLFALILTLPGALIASTVAVIFVHESVWDIVFAYVLPLLYIVLDTFVAFMVALRHPKLKWNNESEAVKNSVSALIAMLLGFAMSIAFGAIMIPTSILLPGYRWVIYLVMTALLLGANLAFYLHLRKNFSSKIDAMEEF